MPNCDIRFECFGEDRRESHAATELGDPSNATKILRKARDVMEINRRDFFLQEILGYEKYFRCSLLCN